MVSTSRLYEDLEGRDVFSLLWMFDRTSKEALATGTHTCTVATCGQTGLTGPSGSGHITAVTPKKNKKNTPERQRRRASCTIVDSQQQFLPV